MRVTCFHLHYVYQLCVDPCPTQGNLGGLLMLDQVRTFLRTATELGLLLVALAVVLQILFGSAVPFVGGDVVGNITSLIGSLGQQGLVGLIALLVIVYLFQRQPRAA